jgi:hypothetical protein
MYVLGILVCILAVNGWCVFSYSLYVSLTKGNKMTPVDFVLFDGDSSPNTPVRDIYEAMKWPLVIQGEFGDFQILSYYYSEELERMVLDIEPKQ